LARQFFEHYEKNKIQQTKKKPCNLPNFLKAWKGFLKKTQVVSLKPKSIYFVTNPN
jgi:hypothetical protein